MKEFKAAVLHSPGAPLAIETVRLGALAPNDVLVRVDATSVCHTDLEVALGSRPAPVPSVLGHEGAGTIAATGAAVKNLAEGESVALHWNPHCGTCYYCEQGDRILCEQYTGNASKGFGFDGQPKLFLGERPLSQLMYLGTFAEYCVVDAQCAVPMPDGMPANRSCLLGCGVMTGYGAVAHVHPVRAGSSVAVIGCGALGLTAVQTARSCGAHTVIAIDLNDAKLGVAEQLGATHTCNPQRDDPVATVQSLTAGRGADFVIEAAGHVDVFATAVAAARPGGHVVWLGKVSPGTPVSFPWAELAKGRHIVRSSYGGARPHGDFPTLANAYLRGELALDSMVTATISLEEINDALGALERGEAIRTVIQMTA